MQQKLGNDRQLIGVVGDTGVVNFFQENASGLCGVLFVGRGAGSGLRDGGSFGLIRAGACRSLRADVTLMRGRSRSGGALCQTREPPRQDEDGSSGNEEVHFHIGQKSLAEIDPASEGRMVAPIGW